MNLSNDMGATGPYNTENSRLAARKFNIHQIKLFIKKVLTLLFYHPGAADSVENSADLLRKVKNP